MSGASRWFEGGCHCGAVRFRVRCAEPVTVYECNCSICSMCGYQHLFTGGDDFELLSGEDHLTDYRFGTGTARHRFCSTCGPSSVTAPAASMSSRSTAVTGSRPTRACRPAGPAGPRDARQGPVCVSGNRLESCAVEGPSAAPARFRRAGPIIIDLRRRGSC